MAKNLKITPNSFGGGENGQQSESLLAERRGSPVSIPNSVLNLTITPNSSNNILELLVNDLF